MRRRITIRFASGAALIAVIISTIVLDAQNERIRAAWNRPQKPFRIFGNTYWVGTYSLGGFRAPTE
jgi:hypothetical protein